MLYSTQLVGNLIPLCTVVISRYSLFRVYGLRYPRDVVKRHLCYRFGKVTKIMFSFGFAANRRWRGRERAPGIIIASQLQISFFTGHRPDIVKGRYTALSYEYNATSNEYTLTRRLHTYEYKYSYLGRYASVSTSRYLYRYIYAYLPKPKHK